MTPLPTTPVLRSLSLPARLVIAAFLVSVGIGYCSALIQLHFRQASPGKLLPTPDDATSAYYGRPELSQMERLLVADEGQAFNGSGSMRQTFTFKSAGWKATIQRRAKKDHENTSRAEEALRRERDGERLALLDWVRHGAERKAFEENSYVLPANLANHPITDKFVETGPDGTKRAKIASILDTRCTRCHAEEKGGSGAQYPLETWEQVHEYCQPGPAGGGMSVKKLAQTSHIHLLGFAMLYGMTGLIFAFTSYPGWLRGVLAPLALVAQVVDISFWWLGRLHPEFARAIVYSGCVVASALLLQIVLSLFNLFGRGGKVVLLLLFVAAGAGGYVLLEQVIKPYLAQEMLTGSPD